MHLFPINKQNIFKATTYAMLLAATAHLITCLTLAIHRDDPDIVNMFNIIGLSQLLPFLAHGALNCLLGIIFVILVGAGFYALLQNHDEQQGRRHKK